MEKTEITPEMIAEIRPLLARAVRTRVAYYEAVSALETELGFDVDSIDDYYEGLVFAADEPKDARRLVTSKATREFLESVFAAQEEN
jgi:hypothetical protein